MRTGTKSLLFGGHQFIIHPIILFFCYWKLYGFPFDPRLWVCFVVHDWGYFGCSDMDGVFGKFHPVYGGNIVRLLFGRKWAMFCMTHSRKIVELLNYILSTDDFKISRLGVADKLAIVYTPIWMYCKEELSEYIRYESQDSCISPKSWKDIIDKKALRFVEDNKDTAYESRHYQ